VVLLIGRLEAYEGLEMFVETTRLVDLPNAWLVIAGPG
jgi:hypothetical protein